MHQIFSIFNTNDSGTNLEMNDLLDGELCKFYLKMFDQGWEDTSSHLGYDLDEHVVENMYERQERKSTLMRNALTQFQQDIAMIKGAE